MASSAHRLGDLISRHKGQPGIPSLQGAALRRRTSRVCFRFVDRHTPTLIGRRPVTACEIEKLSNSDVAA
jgi:hypothetical protein